MGQTLRLLLSKAKYVNQGRQRVSMAQKIFSIFFNSWAKMLIFLISITIRFFENQNTASNWYLNGYSD